MFDSVFKIGFLMIYFVVLEFYSCVRYMHFNDYLPSLETKVCGSVWGTELVCSVS